LLVISDVHFFQPEYFRHAVREGQKCDPPSRLSTDIALGDRKANAFHALIQLARSQVISADALVFCGDLTTCADPTAMNFGWLQLQRLAAALQANEPIVTVGNHDLDSRFQASATTPQRMLRFLDPPFPVSDSSAVASFWANGYCILDRLPQLRVVIVNTCSLHGYASETERQHDHGSIPEEVFTSLPADLAARPAAEINMLLCHHHPLEIDLPGEDRSVIANGDQLIELLESISPPGWLVMHGHRHLPHLRYAGPTQRAPIIFSAGSLAANLHLSLQGRTANQFYTLELEGDSSGVRGRYEAWTWEQHEGEWRKGQDTSALPASGGFGYRPDPGAAASIIQATVPPHDEGTVTWRYIEEVHPEFKFLLTDDRRQILEYLVSRYQIDWESDSGRMSGNARLLRLGRRS